MGRLGEILDTASQSVGWTVIPYLSLNLGRGSTQISSVNKTAARGLLTTILSSPKTPAIVVKELARILLESLSSQPNTTENKEQLRKLLAQLRQRHPRIFSEASLDIVSRSDEDCRAQIEQVILSLSLVSVVAVPVEYLFMSPNVDKPGGSAVNYDGEQGCRSYNRVGRLGSKYTRSGSKRSIRRGR